MHLLIPFAACLPEVCQQTWATLQLPHLTQALARLTPLLPPEPIAADAENSLSPPHERALAVHCGLLGSAGLAQADFAANSPLDGLLPWGALHAQAQAQGHLPSQAWAVITPVNWSVQTAHITLTNPAAVALDEGDSRALLAAMQPYFAQDGITLHYDGPGRWLACGEVFRGLPTASVDRVIGRNVHDWQPKPAPTTAAQAKLLRRLQSEMQMLLYTHPLSDQRSARGLPAVNSFWVSGTGDLPSGFETPVTPVSSSNLVVADGLRAPALHEDWATWGQAWEALDRQYGPVLFSAMAAKPMPATPAARSAIPPAEGLPGDGVALTLCGDRRAITWVLRPQSAWQRLRLSVSSKYRESFRQQLHYML